MMEFTLEAKETAALAPACTVRVRCHAGLLWITGPRDGGDLVLAAGQSALLAPAQRHYLSALGRGAAAAFAVDCEGQAEHGAGLRGWLRALLSRLLSRLPSACAAPG
jgi:hypothetical protein